jgi:hypothetical protein
LTTSIFGYPAYQWTDDANWQTGRVPTGVATFGSAIH